VKRSDFIEEVHHRSRALGLDLSPFSPRTGITVLVGAIEHMVLCLAIEFSARRASTVTASWFLGGTMRWAFKARDVPWTCYRRVAELLTMDERERLCGQEETVAEGVSDFWWSPADGSAATMLADVILLTHPRFLANAPFAAIRRSKEWASRKLACREVAAAVGNIVPLAMLARSGALDPWIAAASVHLVGSRGRDWEQQVRTFAVEAATSAALGVL